MGKKKSEMKMVPMEFGIQEDGTVRLTVHIENPMEIEAVLKQIGRNSDYIVEALVLQMQAFMEEKKKEQVSSE